jgi:flagellar biogenesis protein FliO
VSVADEERPLWQPVSLLIASLTLIVAFVITLAFVVARLVTGIAY